MVVVVVEVIRFLHVAKNATNAIVWVILHGIVKKMLNGVTDVMGKVTLLKTASRVPTHRPVTIATNRDILQGRVQNQGTDKIVTNATNLDIYPEIVRRVRKLAILVTDLATSDATAILILKSSRREFKQKHDFLI